MQSPDEDYMSAKPSWKRLILTACAAATLLQAVAQMVTSRHARPTTLTDSNRLEFRPTNLAGSNSSDTPAHVFHILQLTDIHLGEDSWTEWGPEQDVKTFVAIHTLVRAEKPDLILLTGDQLTANNVNASATAYYGKLGRKISTLGIPWALIFGNHDDAPFEPHIVVDGTVMPTKGKEIPAKTSRQQLLLAVTGLPLSLTAATGPAHVTGVSNYWLDVFLPHTINESTSASSSAGVPPAARILLLDSGGGSLTEQIDNSQIAWVQSTNIETIPVVAFQHIPAVEFAFSAANCQSAALAEDGGVDPLDADAGIVQALGAAGNVHVLGVGHNHGNDYCCRHPLSMLHLCFGRHSGYGGYGSWERGARVYQLRLNARGDWMGWKSWVRLESGDVVDDYEP